MQLNTTYKKGDFVFAQSQGYKPYPAKITQINHQIGIYSVKFINYKSTAELLPSMIEPFNNRTIEKYIRIYQKSKDNQEKIILKKIKQAKLMYQGGKKSGRGKKKGRGKYRMLSQDEDQVSLQLNQEGILYPKTMNFIQNENLMIPEENQNIFSLHKQQLQTELNRQNLNDFEQIKGDLQWISSMRDHSPQFNSQQPLQIVTIQNYHNHFNQQKKSHQPQESLKSSDKSSVKLFIFGQMSQIDSMQIKPSKGQMISQKNVKELSRRSIDTPQHRYFHQIIQLSSDQPQQQYQTSQDSFQEPPLSLLNLNTITPINPSDIDNSYDSLSLSQDNHHRFIQTLSYRHKKLSIYSQQTNILRLNTLILLLKQHLLLHRPNPTKHLTFLSIKKRQYLITILHIKDISLKYYLQNNCLYNMLEFIFIYQAAGEKLQEKCRLEYFQIRGKLNMMEVQLEKWGWGQGGFICEEMEEIGVLFREYQKRKVLK